MDQQEAVRVELQTELESERDQVRELEERIGRLPTREVYANHVTQRVLNRYM